MPSKRHFEVGDLIIDDGGGFFGIVDEVYNDNELVYHGIKNNFMICHAYDCKTVRRCTVYEAMVLVGKMAVAKFVEHCNPMTPAIDILNDELRDIENDNGEKKPYLCYNWLYKLLDDCGIRKFSEVDKIRADWEQKKTEGNAKWWRKLEVNDNV